MFIYIKANNCTFNVKNGLDFDYIKYPDENVYIVFGYTNNPAIKEILIDYNTEASHVNGEITLDVSSVIQLEKINDNLKVWHVLWEVTDELRVKGVNKDGEVIKEILKEM